MDTQPQQARRHEVCQWHLDVPQPADMGDEAGCLDGKNEIRRHLFGPVGESIRTLHAIEGAIDLDRAKMAGGILQLVFALQALG